MYEATIATDVATMTRDEVANALQAWHMDEPADRVRAGASRGEVLAWIARVLGPHSGPYALVEMLAVDDNAIGYDKWDDFVQPLLERGVDVAHVPAERADEVVAAWPFGEFVDIDATSDAAWAREGGPWLDIVADELIKEGYLDPRQNSRYRLRMTEDEEAEVIEQVVANECDERAGCEGRALGRIDRTIVIEIDGEIHVERWPSAPAAHRRFAYLELHYMSEDDTTEHGTSADLIAALEEARADGWQLHDRYDGADDISPAAKRAHKRLIDGEMPAGPAEIHNWSDETLAQIIIDALESPTPAGLERLPRACGEMCRRIFNAPLPGSSERQELQRAGAWAELPDLAALPQIREMMKRYAASATCGHGVCGVLSDGAGVLIGPFDAGPYLRRMSGENLRRLVEGSAGGWSQEAFDLADAARTIVGPDWERMPATDTLAPAGLIRVQLDVNDLAVHVAHERADLDLDVMRLFLPGHAVKVNGR